eukprot:1160906-Pelagomonas_calceolata.AAC.4
MLKGPGRVGSAHDDQTFCPDSCVAYSWIFSDINSDGLRSCCVVDPDGFEILVGFKSGASDLGVSSILMRLSSLNTVHVSDAVHLSETARLSGAVYVSDVQCV